MLVDILDDLQRVMSMLSNENDTEGTFFFIPHTHWEGAVFKTREQYLKMGLPNILKALRLLKMYPSYRFTLDQTCYIAPFLERYPEEAAAFHRFVQEGRLAIVGGAVTMPDVNMPGGESFVRHVLYGKGYFRRELGVEVTTGWQLDTFGHHAQMPQLLKLAGYKSLWFARGVADWDVAAEFVWEGIDGSRIPAFWLPHGYAVAYGSPTSLDEFAAFFQECFDRLGQFTPDRDRVGPAGADVCVPEEHVPPLVDEFNRVANRVFRVQIAVPADYEKAVEKRGTRRPLVTGELNPIFQGIYSSRIELKQRTRELERLLITAEKLGVLLQPMGIATSKEVLCRAWEPLLFNQAHDLMSGVMTDQVYDDTIRGYDFSQRIAQDEAQRRLQHLISQIDTRGEGIPLVVLNTLGWARSDIARASIGFAEDQVRSLTLVGPDGQSLPIQVLESQTYANGGLLRAEIAFVARDVPAMGHAVYRILPMRSDPVCGPDPAQRDALENDYYRLEINPACGAIAALTVKDGDWPALSDGNVVAMETDRGDLWEPYRPLDGGSSIAMKERHPAPQSGTALFATGDNSARGTARSGPVLSEFTVCFPFGNQGRISSRIRLYADLRRIDMRTTILNNERFVRYRLLFPTSVKNGRSVHEIPFGAVQRPEGIEFPAQNWIDYGNDTHGVALLNRGLPGNNVADGTMMLSLLRCTRIVAYGFGGGYEPGMSSDSGFELGQERTFDYALLPHAGDWRQASVWREGMAFNNPLLVHTASPHPGRLPNRHGFVEISAPNVALSTLKTGESGGAVLRIYEAEGKEAKNTRVRLALQTAAAEEVNLMEDSLRKLPVTDNAVRLDLGPFEIKTIRFEF